jgi:hypothetical protein
MKLKRFAVGLALTIPLAAAGLAVAANVFGDARPATAGFHHVQHAVATGYDEFRDAQGIACIELPGTGAMGIHYVNGSLVGDAVLDTSRPEGLVYERRGQNLHLVALEYIVFKSVWEEAGNTEPPRLLGREFDLVPDPNRYGLPAFYALHAWAWKVNPSGDFFAWNPRVDC